MPIAAFTDVSNCVVWNRCNGSTVLKTDDATQVSARDVVGRVNDESGAANHTEGFGGKEPIYLEAPDARCPCIAFRNYEVAKQLNLKSTLAINNQSCSLYFVVRPAMSDVLSTAGSALFQKLSTGGDRCLIQQVGLTTGVTQSTPVVVSKTATGGGFFSANDGYHNTGLYLPISKCVVELVSDGTGWEITVNGRSYASAIPLIADSTAGGNIGSFGATQTLPWYGELMEFVAYSRRLNTAERSDVIDLLKRSNGIPAAFSAVVHVLGDSIFAGTSALDDANPNAGSCSPAMMMGLPNSIEVFNQSRTSMTVANIQAMIATKVAPMIRAGVPNYFMTNGGVNDLFAARTPSQIFADLNSLISAAGAMGLRPIVSTVLPSSASESDRSTLNTLIRTLPASMVCDVAAELRIGEYADRLNTYWYHTDNIHAKATMASVIGEAMGSKVVAELASGVARAGRRLTRVR